MPELVGTGSGAAWSGGGSGQPHAAADAAFAVGRSCGETARLQRQAEELAPESRVLLERTALGPGQRAIDVGCGPRGILELLVEFVGPAGRVVGLDSDPVLIELAMRFAAERGWDNVELICADARHSGLPSDAFDVVHARTLLIGLSQPADVLTELVRLTRPSGWVVGMEPDAEHLVCHPPHPAVDRLSELLTRALARQGADPHLGRRLAELYHQAGLTDVTVEVRTPVYPPGHSRRTILTDLVRSLRAPILGLGLATERELEELDAAARVGRHIEVTPTSHCPMRDGSDPGVRPRGRRRRHDVPGGTARTGLTCTAASSILDTWTCVRSAPGGQALATS